MDVNRAMLIWEKFFENSMKRQMFKSVDDWGVGVGGLIDSGYQR